MTRKISTISSEQMILYRQSSPHVRQFLSLLFADVSSESNTKLDISIFLIFFQLRITRSTVLI